MGFPDSYNGHGEDPSAPSTYQYPAQQGPNVTKTPSIRRQVSSGRPLNAQPATPRMLRNVSSSLKNSISSINDVSFNDEYSQSTLSPQANPNPEAAKTHRSASSSHSRNPSIKRILPPIDTNGHSIPLPPNIPKPDLLPPAQIQSPHSEPVRQRSLDPQQQQPKSQMQSQPVETAPPDPQQQFHRKAIGNWDLIKTIGAGSMGKVKLAKHNRTNEICAVKIVPRAAKLYQRAHMNDPPPADVSSAAKRTKEYEKELARDKRTIREGALGRLLFHPYICRLYEMIPMTNHYYMLFEYVQGGQMLDYIVSHGSLKERHARKFARGIASALDYCHQNSIVHRDLKIENIMINKNGDIKIIDFGLSNLYSPKKLLKTYCGSLYFAAPELLSAHPYTGPEVDIWSFGVVLYVLVCGKVPFDDQSVSVLHEKIKKGNVEYPSFLSRECISLLSRMLVVDPLKRAALREVKNHPWMVKGYEGPPSNYMPHRFPLKLPLNNENIQLMASFDLGSEQSISESLTSIINSVEYQLAYDNWYKQNNLGNTEYFDDILPDPTKGYHPLISIYYLVDEMRKRKKTKDEAIRNQLSDIEQKQQEERLRLDQEKPDQQTTVRFQQPPPQQEPKSNKPTLSFPEQAHTFASQQYSQSSRPSTEIPADPTSLPSPNLPDQHLSSPSRPRANTTHVSIEYSPQQDHTITKQSSINSLLRKLSSKRTKGTEPAPPLPKVSLNDYEFGGSSSKDPMMRRGVSMKITSKEKDSSSKTQLAPNESSTGYKAGHGRASSTSATHPSNAKYQGYTPAEYLPPLPTSKDSIGSSNQQLATNGLSAPNRNLHPSARAKSVGHVRRESINFRRQQNNGQPPLPNSFSSQNSPDHNEEGFFDDVTLEDLDRTARAAIDIPQLTDHQIIQQFEHAKPGSMPSIEYPKTFFLKGFFSVQTTSAKPLPVIRYNVIFVLSKLGVKFTEVKGGFICTHVPSLEGESDAPILIDEVNSKEKELYGDAFKSTTSSIEQTLDESMNTTTTSSASNDQSHKTHRRKFSLGNTLLNYRKKNGSQSQLTQPHSPTPSNYMDLSLHDDSEDSLDSINGMGGSDMLVSSRLEHRAKMGNVPTTPGGTSQQPPLTPIKKSRTPLKFEIHLVRIPIVSLYGVQFKKVIGNTWSYKTLASQILKELKL